MTDTDCMKCNRQDTGEMAIQCDRCDGWLHYGCTYLIGLDDEMAERIVNFYCLRCEDRDHIITWRRKIATKQQKADKAKHYFEIEGILDHRTVKIGRMTRREFLVEWKDCPVSPGSDENQSTWEPEPNLDGAIDELQLYLAVHRLPMSNIEGLIGADGDSDEHDFRNWIRMSQLIDTFSKWRSWLKIKSELKASEFTQFGSTDELLFMPFEHHCYVLLYKHQEKLAFIADGSNLFIRDQEIANDIKCASEVDVDALW